MSISWEDSDESLTWDLVNCVYDNDDIREGLFPGTGSNMSTKRGGGKTKTEWYEIIAKKILQDHATYGEYYRAAIKTKDGAAVYGGKVKNKLSR